SLHPFISPSPVPRLSLACPSHHVSLGPSLQHIDLKTARWSWGGLPHLLVDAACLFTRAGRTCAPCHPRYGLWALCRKALSRATAGLPRGRGALRLSPRGSMKSREPAWRWSL